MSVFVIPTKIEVYTKKAQTRGFGNYAGIIFLIEERIIEDEKLFKAYFDEMEKPNGPHKGFIESLHRIGCTFLTSNNPSTRENLLHALSQLPEALSDFNKLKKINTHPSPQYHTVTKAKNDAVFSKSSYHIVRPKNLGFYKKIADDKKMGDHPGFAFLVSTGIIKNTQEFMNYYNQTQEVERAQLFVLDQLIIIAIKHGTTPEKNTLLDLISGYYQYKTSQHRMLKKAT